MDRPPPPRRPRDPRDPRHRRPDPQRTGPIRNAGEAWRDSERPYDAASNGVREGYRVIDEQIRRGHRMAQTLDEEDRSGGPPRRGQGRRSWHDEDDRRYEPRGGYRIPETPMGQVGCLARDILRQIGSARPDPWRLAELILRLQLAAVSELARLGFSALGGFTPRYEDPLDEDVERIDRDIDESFDGIEDVQEEIWEEERETEPWDLPEAASAPVTIRSTVPIRISVSSHERTEIDLDLPAEAQSQELEIEAPRVSGATHRARPAFEAELAAHADGPAVLRVEVPRDLPAGRYRRRVLVRATGEPVGNLTVQVGLSPAGELP
jgi:hypothetical protein